MPDYRESSTAAVTTWRRSHHVEVFNPLPGSGAPFIEYREQDCIRLGPEQVVTVPARTVFPLAAQFKQGGVFPLRNPDTGELLNRSMTHDELRVALASLYWHTAEERDARELAAKQAAEAAAAAAAAAEQPDPAPDGA